MNAEIISIGDELTSGQRLDTNSQWLSLRLGDLGIQVLYHTTVGDDLATNVRVLREAFDRVDFVVCSGGLGPTADDLTRRAIAEAAGVELVLDETVLQHLRALFARRKREMPQANVIQAQFPKGSWVIPNPHGTAPGIGLDLPRPGRPVVRVFALPGVPAEMREMWEQTVRPELTAVLAKHRRVIRRRRIKCFGVGESDLEKMLPDLIRRGRHPSVGITVSRATITLRITVEGASDEACDSAMEPVVQTIRQCLGHLVFGEEDDELQHVVLRMLHQHHQTLATVEWGTGGLVAHWLSEADENRGAYFGGLVIGDDTNLTKSLAINANVLARHEMNSDEVLAACAANCRASFSVDHGLVVGPFPTAASETAEPGLFRCALAGPGGVQVKSFTFAGHPDILKARAGKQALDVLRMSLLTSGPPRLAIARGPSD